MKYLSSKRIAVFVFMLTALFNFTSCNKLLDNFELKSSFSEDVTINIGPDDELTYSDELTVDLSTNADFVENADHVTQFTLTKISYIVTQYTGAEGIEGSGTTTFYNGNSQIGDPIIQTDVNFGDLYNSGASIILPISQATIDELSSVLKSTMKFRMLTEGSVTGKPVYVLMEVTAEVTANVEP